MCAQPRAAHSLRNLSHIGTRPGPGVEAEQDEARWEEPLKKVAQVKPGQNGRLVHRNGTTVSQRFIS